jgi:methionine-rich copper-binding protein CopC
MAAINIVNTAGQTVFAVNRKMEKGNNSFTISEASMLPKGVYMVVIKAGDITEQRKIVKQ